MQERLNPSFDWRESFILDSWLHRNVHFDSKSRLPPVRFLGKLHMVLKLRKSGTQLHKRFVIWSWNKGDMVVWSKAAKRVCYYRIVYGSNSFCLFGLIFWATFWAWKFLNCGSYIGASFGQFWCQILVSSLWQLALVHNWKVVKNIPWPLDLFLNISFFYAYCYIACDEKYFQSY